MSVTRQQARAAKNALAETLLTAFNTAAGSPVNGVGLAKEGDDYFVQVYLEREPTKQETTNLPKEYQGVRVKYNVIGPITPQ